MMMQGHAHPRKQVKLLFIIIIDGSSSSATHDGRDGRHAPAKAMENYSIELVHACKEGPHETSFLPQNNGLYINITIGRLCWVIISNNS